jgi:GAF domain-containing protein
MNSLQAFNDCQLRLSRRFLTAQDVGEILDVLLDEVREHVGYETVWLYLYRDEEDRVLELWDARGVKHVIPTIPIDGDPMLEETLAAQGPVVVVDARTDPRTNKEFVATLDCRTLVNVPLLLADRRLGALGTGSFGAEGVRAPEPFQLAFLTTLAVQTAVAIDRVFILEQRRALHDQLLRAQKLDAIGNLTGGIAHDFNNILTAILGCSELLERKLEPDDPNLRWVREIQGAVKRGASLSDQLLAFARRQVVDPCAT